MRKLFSLMLCIVLSAGAALAQMSDAEVVNYAIAAQNAGKSQQQIYVELTQRGVTAAQLQRILNNSAQTVSAAQATTNTAPQNTIDRSRNTTAETIQSPVTPVATSRSSGGKKIFGHDIFNTSGGTFEPNINLATPVDYKLGPGDEIVIDIWGVSESSLRQIISPEGSITVSGLGPVYLNGMTINEARQYLGMQLANIYDGLNEGTASVMVTLGQARTIMINLMGEVKVPGTYRLSSFSNVLHALYAAGGITEIGSLREIWVMRNNKRVADIDIYDIIINGESANNVRLEDNDVIIVPPYRNLVHIDGYVRRPMYYEAKSGQSVIDIISYAGGFSGPAYREQITLTRSTGGEQQIFTVHSNDFNTFFVTDGDAISIKGSLDRYENRVLISGAVMRPGYYEVSGDMRTITDLIMAAGGLRGDEFTNRAVLVRENDDLTKQLVSVDLQGILSGYIDDIVLKNNDELTIASINDIKQNEEIVISGDVAKPGKYSYAQNMTLEDLVILAGGLLESASEIRVDVSRRIKNPRATGETRHIGEIHTISLKEGLRMDSGEGFVLEPFDEIHIRRSPGYQVQQNVSVQGEVLFEGTYSLTNKTERLSDLIMKAGGLTSDAYVEGARIIRRLSENEQRLRNSTYKILAERGSLDSVSMELLEMSASYNVGIDLELALTYPGSDYDMVLQESDQLVIPKYSNTVTIDGAVLYPNTVLYVDGQGIKYYINQSGGFAKGARRKKIFVVHLNGTVSRYRGSKDIRPGSEIIIPSRDMASRMSMAEIMAIAQTATSIGLMSTSIANMVK